MCEATTEIGGVLTHKVKISRKVLKELCTRWIERRGGFLIRFVFVPLSLLDVSVGLGLGVSGEDIELESEHVDSFCRSLFNCGIVKVKMVFDEVVKCHSHGTVDEFCKLYILLGLSKFLFPNKMGNVYSGLFNIVDNLGELHKFKWGHVFIHISSKAYVKLQGAFTTNRIQLFVSQYVYTCCR